MSHGTSLGPRMDMVQRAQVDRWFARFRERGDVAALAALFDATAPELLRVAQYLAGDSHAAEDLVQATFLVAIEDAASHDPERAVLPWLLGILANRARDLRKARLRAHRDVARANGIAADDPPADAARAEFAAKLRDVLAALPSPYGEVLRLHLEHGLTAKEIGEALQRPAGTVRTQVVRGMELLRAALPAGFAAAAFVAVAPGQGLAAMREVVLAKAAGHAGAAAAALGTVGFVTGMLAMKKTLLAAGAVLAVSATWFAWPEPTTAARASVAPEATGAPALAAVDALPTETRPAPEPDANAARAAVPAAAAGAMRVRLVWADDGTPVPRAWIAYRPFAAGPHQTRTVECQPDGVAVIGELAPARYAVSVAAQEAQQVDVAAGATAEATLRLRPEVVIDGVVVDPGGKPVAGAAIRTPNLVDLPVLTTSRADGTFAWRGLYLSEAWAEKDGRLPSRLQLVTKFEGKPHTLQFVLGGEGVEFEGLVLHANGAPAAGARLAISVEEGPAPLVLADGQPVRDVPPVTVRADGGGRFVTCSVPAGRHWLVASAQGSAPVELGVDVVAVAEPTVIRLAAGATVRGVIRDRDGKPVAARVNAWSSLGRSRGLFPLGHYVADAHGRADADAEGRYVLAHLPAGKLQLQCMAAGMAAVGREAELSADEELEWDPVLAPENALRGQVVGAAGEPLAGWNVQVRTDPPGVRQHTHATTDAEGRFTAPLAGGATATVWALPPPATGAAASVHWGHMSGVRTSRTDVVLRTGWRDDAPAWLVGRMLDGAGHAVANVAIQSLPKDRAWDHDHRTVTGVDGSFRIGPLPAGKYELWVNSVGHAQVRRLLELDAGRTLDLGGIVLAAKGTVTVTARFADGKAPADLTLGLRAEDRSYFGVRPFTRRDDGTWQSEPWPPGPLRLEVWGPGIARSERAVEVRPGTDTPVEVELRAGTPTKFLFEQPAPRRTRWQDHLKLTVRDASGQESTQTIEVDGGETFAWTRGFAPGRYAFTARSSTDGRCTTDGSFVVVESQPAEVRVTFPDRTPPRPPRGEGPMGR